MRYPQDSFCPMIERNRNDKDIVIHLISGMMLLYLFLLLIEFVMDSDSGIGEIFRYMRDLNSVRVWRFYFHILFHSFNNFITIILEDHVLC